MIVCSNLIQKFKTVQKDPFVFYLPFLCIYIGLVVLLHDNGMEADESNYLEFAENLLNGYYSPPNEINLWSGPGYPIFLTPFVFFEMPLLSITLFNAVFQYLSIILLFYTIRSFSSFKAASIFSLLWAFYFISWHLMPLIMTEGFAIFLIALSAYFISRSFFNNKKSHKIIAGLTIGFLALTKIIFGYVILCCLIFYTVFSLMNAFLKKAIFKKEMTILAISLIPLIPYLFYTYNLTGRLFYFGNSGGQSLYFMSTPYLGEFGDWNNEIFTGYCNDDIQPCNAEFFLKNHEEDYRYIFNVKGVERDDRFKEIAIRNIKNNPIKYVRNCISNQGRMWFGFPFSYHFQKDIFLGIAFPNAILFALFLYMLMFWFIRIREIRRDLNFIFIFLMIYLTGSTFLSAYPRQLYIIVPMMLVLIAYAINQSVKIELFPKDTHKAQTDSEDIQNKETCLMLRKAGGLLEPKRKHQQN